MFNNILLYTNDLKNNVNQIEQPKHDIFDRYFTNPTIVKYSFISFLILIIAYVIVKMNMTKSSTLLDIMCLTKNEIQKNKRIITNVHIAAIVDGIMILVIFIVVMVLLIILPTIISVMLIDILKENIEMIISIFIMVIFLLFFLGFNNKDDDNLSFMMNCIFVVLLLIPIIIILYYLKLDDNNNIEDDKSNDYIKKQ